jgi:hypothetical protein
LIDRDIRDSPSTALPICQRLCDWLHCAIPENIPLLLQPLESAVGHDVIDDALAQVFASFVKITLQMVAIDFSGLSALVSFVRALSDHYAQSVEPITDFVRLFVKVVPEERPHLEEEDLDDEEGPIPGLARLVFDLDSTKPELPVLHDLIVRFIEQIRFAPPESPDDRGPMPGVLLAFTGLLDDPE